MKYKVIFIAIGIITALITTLAGCGSIKTAGSDTVGASTGRLIVSIIDAPGVPEIDRVMLTITGMEIHKAGTADTEQEQEQNNSQGQNQEANQDADNSGWIDLELANATDGELTFNLLDYRNGLQLDAAMADLQPGTYTQIRMDVKSVQIGFTDEPGEENLKDAKLPSNVLKFISTFEIAVGQDTQLLFDINALKSVHQTGSENYIFRPVIKMDIIENPVETLAITTSLLPEATQGAAYTATQLEAAGGKGPYTWSLDSGSVLPVDLTLSPSGLISGNVDAGDTIQKYEFTVKVQDSAYPQNFVTQALSIDVVAPPVTP